MGHGGELSDWDDEKYQSFRLSMFSSKSISSVKNPSISFLKLTNIDLSSIHNGSIRSHFNSNQVGQF
jgi:hypothetical protein